MSDDTGDGAEPGEDIPRDQRRRFARLGEQLTGLLDPESAFRRGSGIVTGVTQATKDELIRIVSAEMRNFLDKMDAADLLQQVIAGLVIDVNMQVKFSREGNGPAQPEITRNEAKIRLEDDDRRGRGDRRDDRRDERRDDRRDERRDDRRDERRDEPGSSPSGETRGGGGHHKK